MEKVERVSHHHSINCLESMFWMWCWNLCFSSPGLGLLISIWTARWRLTLSPAAPMITTTAASCLTSASLVNQNKKLFCACTYLRRCKPSSRRRIRPLFKEDYEDRPLILIVCALKSRTNKSPRLIPLTSISILHNYQCYCVHHLKSCHNPVLIFNIFLQQLLKGLKVMNVFLFRTDLFKAFITAELW